MNTIEYNESTQNILLLLYHILYGPRYTRIMQHLYKSYTERYNIKYYIMPPTTTDKNKISKNLLQ